MEPYVVENQIFMFITTSFKTIILSSNYLKCWFSITTNCILITCMLLQQVQKGYISRFSVIHIIGYISSVSFDNDIAYY